MDDLLTVTDQMGREVVVPFSPKRIISLVPSQTEFLLDIGAPVVGRTKFCVQPSNGIKAIEVVGGTKNFRFEKIRELQPDLIIGNKEENYKEGIDQLSENYPVWMSDIYMLADSFRMMQEIGKVCNLEKNATKIIRECESALETVKGNFAGKVIYLIWKNPWMAAGKSTFIDDLLSHLGYENLIQQDRYPELTERQIKDLSPDKILFSSEPFPFQDLHLEEANRKWPKAESRLVDGELHSWYGSRLRNWR